MAGKKEANLPREGYEKELPRLQTELVKLQEGVRAEGVRLVVIFEGRDAAGKGGTIKRVAEHLNPRVARIAALRSRPSVSARSGTSSGMWSICRRPGRSRCSTGPGTSWAGGEHVMGFCLLRKYWFSVSDTEQQERFRRRLEDPLRRWKLSPMDLESITRWEAYSRAKDEMLVNTDISEAPWYVVDSDDKRRARLKMMAHRLSSVAYHEVSPPVLELPHRPPSTGYKRPPRDLQTYVPDHAARL